MSELLKHPGESSSNDQSPAGKEAEHTRRTFLFKIAVLLNAAVGAVLAMPIAGYLLGPAMKKASNTGSWIAIGSVDDFPVGETRLVDFKSPVATLGDGETAKVACWVRRVSTEQFQVFAINCAHLGCPVRWFAQSKLFMCPCHGGAYYEDGSRASGPPERGLFEYKYKLAGNTLSIHAGDMPTLATQASCTEKSKSLINIEPMARDTGNALPEGRSNLWLG
jgi:menaquinol-cytochrome c reductase iron-sulfur subunit